MQASAFDDDAITTDMIQAYEADNTALGRLFRRQALELKLEFSKGILCVTDSCRETGLPLYSLDRWPVRCSGMPVGRLGAPHLRRRSEADLTDATLHALSSNVTIAALLLYAQAILKHPQAGTRKRLDTK